MDAGQLEARKARARAWFEELRDDICAAFEGLEDGLPGDAPRAPRRPIRRGVSCAPPGGAPITAARPAAAA